MSVVDDVKARLDIVDVISGYTQLQKAGRNYKALCPFHQEKTPSFVVFPDTQTWRCFGACGEGGDVFGFVMKREGWDFAETLRELAKRAGVDLRPESSHQAEQQAQHERLYALIEAAALFFHDGLRRAPEAQIARDYIIGRGLTQQTAETFLLGYAPNDWHRALHHLQMLGYTQDEIVEAGVAIHNEKGNVYDRFRHRLVIPIRDPRGRVVGFGARAFAKDDHPKYLNSPQGPLFDKSRLLYGMDLARRAIREHETVVIVEGYMDVIQAHQAGFTNVVAQMGTALTEAQLRQLDRMARRLILALDPDTAGINATMRGLDVARQTLEGDSVPTFDPRGMMRYSGALEMDIRVVSLPDGQDPDDLIRHDPTAWQTLIAAAIPVADFVIRQSTAHLDEHSTIQEREAVARVLLPILTATENDLHRSGNIQALARRVRIDERLLLQWAQQRQVTQTRAVASPQEQRRLISRRAVPPGPVTLHQRERWAAGEGFCLHLLLQQPEWLYDANRKLRALQGGNPALAEPLAPLHVGDFSRPDHQAIFRAVERALFEGEADPVDYATRHLPAEVVEVLDALRIPVLDSFQHSLPPHLEVEFHSILREQIRVNALPEPTASVFVQEALSLRHAALERALQELYFMQQDAQLQEYQEPDAYHYVGRISAMIRARQLIAVAVQTMRNLLHEQLSH